MIFKVKITLSEQFGNGESRARQAFEPIS